MARPVEVAHDTTPSIIDDHGYEPKAEPWSLCKHCNLAESAHSRTAIHYVGDDDDDDVDEP
jgi:hypothetical protein